MRRGAQQAPSVRRPSYACSPRLGSLVDSVAALRRRPVGSSPSLRRSGGVAVLQQNACRAERQAWASAEETDHGDTGDLLADRRARDSSESPRRPAIVVGIRTAAFRAPWRRTLTGHTFRSHPRVYKQPPLLAMRPCSPPVRLSPSSGLAMRGCGKLTPRSGTGVQENAGVSAVAIRARALMAHRSREAERGRGLTCLGAP
jgi:hypothetical protein